MDPALAGVTITDSVISGNSAANGGGLYFGGGGPLTLTNVTFSGNSATDNGGGMYSVGGTRVALSNSTITGGNSAVLGGGLYLAGVATLTNSTVSGNVATTNGGGLYVAGGTKTLTNSTISGNSAATSGGGVYVAGGATTLTNSTVSGNRAASHGGGFYVSTGATTLNFVTVTGNVADDNTDGTGDGGGLAVASGTVTVGNSLVVGNVDKGSQPPDCLGTIVSLGHNLWGEQFVCPNNVGLGDRNLVALGLTAAAALNPALADNGGPTRTHALAVNGPARNLADSGPACTGSGPGQAGGKDQRGIARPQAGGCDSGAYEEVEVILTTGVQGPGGLTPATGGYSVGIVVTLVATPANAQSIFTGWTVDGTPQGWANPLTITMSASRTVVANFAPVVPFSDVGIGQLFTQPIIELAARGYIKGYGDGTYGPTDRTVRAQMAALIARALGYSDSPANPFTDKCDAQNANCVDAELWNRVAELASRTIARGYTDPATCGASGTPCYAPRDFVLHAQVLSFITRAMVAQGYWVQQPTNAGLYGGVLVGTGHEQDVTTYIFYTQAFGGVPDYPAGGFFPAWEQPATRGWFARALWTALNSYFAVDRVP